MTQHKWSLSLKIEIFQGVTADVSQVAGRYKVQLPMFRRLRWPGLTVPRYHSLLLLKDNKNDSLTFYNPPSLHLLALKQPECLQANIIVEYRTL